MLTRDSDIDDKNKALISAIKNNQATKVKFYFNIGANPNVNKQSEKPCLILAVCQNNEEIVRLFIDHGAEIDPENEVDPKNKDSQTPLSIAAAKGNGGIMKILIQHGAKVSLQKLDKMHSVAIKVILLAYVLYYKKIIKRYFESFY